MSSTIPSGLRGDVMRKRIEDKNTLQNKGSLYVGTGESETINVNGTNYPVYETTELEVGEDNEILVVDESAENSLKYSLINTENVANNAITGNKIDFDSCINETVSGSYLESASLKKDITNNKIALSLSEAQWDSDLNTAGSAITAIHCDAIMGDNKNESGSGYDFTYGNGRYVLLSPDNNYTSEKYIISATSVNLPDTADLLNPISNTESNTNYITYTKTHNPNTYTYDVIYNGKTEAVQEEHFGVVANCIPAMYRENTQTGRKLVLPSFNFLAVGNTIQNATITVKEEISGNIIPLGSDGFYHVPYGVLLRFDITFPITQDPIHTPITNGYFGPANTFVPQLTSLGELYTSDGTKLTYSSGATVYTNYKPSGFPQSLPTGKTYYFSGSISLDYTIAGTDVDDAKIGWGRLLPTPPLPTHTVDINCEDIVWSIGSDQSQVNVGGATNQNKTTSYKTPGVRATVALNNIGQGNFMKFYYDGAVNQIGYYYIQYGASSNNEGGGIVIPLKGQ